jgi:hypothetical protein
MVKNVTKLIGAKAGEIPVLADEFEVVMLIS